MAKKRFHIYLNNRKQCVQTVAVLSDMLIVDVKSCVPQVSVFGPLLFSLCFCETRLVLLSVYHLLIQSFLQCCICLWAILIH